ncbi:Rrf2 family transcriptional regulator [Gemella cuniculi]|uniref:Rrf2 family transcriptional regulator n=1 Tax=Gemella cuniculi TaxID=150240 RepID=UPI0003FFF0C5|nr:Rrf2 family transcriptional regulator [Gemella cuniculi]
MRNSNRLSYAVHILSYIYIINERHNEEKISSEKMAASLNVTPITVRQIMGNLKAAGFIETVRGSAKVKILKKPEDITFLDIFQAVSEENIFYRYYDTNINCPIGKNVPLIMDEFYNNVEEATQKEMEKYTLNKVIENLKRNM